MKIDLNESFKPIQQKGYINNRIQHLNNNSEQTNIEKEKIIIQNLEETDDLTKLLTRTINKIETNKSLNEGSSSDMKRTIKLIEKQNTTNGDEIYNKMKKEFINKQHKKSVDDIEKGEKENIKELKNNNENAIKAAKKATQEHKKLIKKSDEIDEKKYKEILKNPTNEYGLGEEIIREIFKIAEKKNFVFPSTIERSFKVCKILNIRNTEDLKEKEEDFEYLVFNF